MIKKYFKLKCSDIALVQFIVEGYEGMATVTTVNPHTSIIRMAIMPNFLPEILILLENLKNKYNLEEIAYPE